MVALLHSGNPGKRHNKYVMCKESSTINLNPRFTESGDLVVESEATFVASRKILPRYVTIWDGPSYRTTVPIKVDGVPCRGDTVNVTLKWSMGLTQLIID